MSTKIILTRKIQLRIDSKETVYLKETYATLHRWQHICRKAANYIFTHCYLQEQVKDIFYLNENIQTKLTDVAKDENGLLTTSRTNSTYQILSKYFKGSIPMSILSCLNNSLVILYKKERLDYIKGVRSLRNYKRDIPMPIAATDIRHLKQIQSERDFSFTLFGIPFRTYLGRDDDKKMFLQNIVAGEMKLHTSNIQLDNGKIYLHIAFEYKQEPYHLLPDIIAEASLSMEMPIVVNISNNKYLIGNKEEYLHHRLAIQAAIERTRIGAAYNRSGKGRKRKLKGLDKFRDVETNYVDHKLHLYSRKLIDICLRHHAATLLLTNGKEIKEDQKDNGFLLRNWSYSNLRDKIMYKAKMVGIVVIEE